MLPITGVIHHKADKSDPFNNFVVIRIDLHVNPYSNNAERIRENKRRRLVVKKAKEFLCDISSPNVKFTPQSTEKAP